jgi:hypothetical protein
MQNWILSTQSTNIVIVGVASLFFFCGPNAEATQEVRNTKSCIVYPTEHSMVIAETLENSLRFQRLAAQWRTERGATSSIDEMCTRPAYLSILAMGRDALPLLLSQLRSEGADPDHWFVALHYITRGVNPVPDEDRGDLERMSKAWLDWAEQNDAG